MLVRVYGHVLNRTNDAEGVAHLVDELRPLKPAVVIVEATGGYEIAIIKALDAAHLNACGGGNPASARAPPAPMRQALLL